MNNFLDCVENAVTAECNPQAASWQREMDYRLLGESFDCVRHVQIEALCKETQRVYIDRHLFTSDVYKTTALNSDKHHKTHMTSSSYMKWTSQWVMSFQRGALVFSAQDLFSRWLLVAWTATAPWSRETIVTTVYDASRRLISTNSWRESHVTKWRRLDIQDQAIRRNSNVGRFSECVVIMA